MSEPSASPFRYHDHTIGAAFVDTAQRHADRPAVLTAGAAVSYAQLAGSAGGVASQLRGCRAGGRAAGGDRVGLLLDHGVDMVAAMLGVLATGGCYVPLDPSYPRERLRVMTEQAGVAVILTHRNHRELAEFLSAGATRPTRPVPVVEVNDLPPAPLAVAAVDPGSPAYILFTSGSTGRPKGVTHSHRSVLHGIANHVVNLRIRPDDRISLVTSFSYDMSVSDLYGAVLSGAAVVPVDLRTQGLSRLAETLAGCGVTIYHSTPTIFRYLVDFLVDTAGPDSRLPEIRVVLLGGEAANRTDLRQARRYFARECLFVHGYGATEATFTVQHYVPAGAEPAGDQQVLPIGRPLAGYEIVLLDPDGAPLADTWEGPAELAIRSSYLGLGYWGDPQRTAERFSADGTLYRTGDIVRRVAGGQLQLLGRHDRQVKVNGHRVELGEVEAQLAAVPGVARAVAVARPARDGGTQIHCYVLPTRGGEPDPARLRDQLAARVPAYLVPHRMRVVGDLPLTTTGKVDIAALPDLAAVDPTPDTSGAGPEAGSVAVPAYPADVESGAGSEALVARVWCEVLGLGEVGRRVSFFDAGGTSLALARLQYRLVQLAGIEIPLVRLLEHPTVAAMATYLDGADAPAGSVSPLASAVERMARRRARRRVAAGRSTTQREAVR